MEEQIKERKPKSLIIPYLLWKELMNVKIRDDCKSMAEVIKQLLSKDGQ